MTNDAVECVLLDADHAGHLLIVLADYRRYLRYCYTEDAVDGCDAMDAMHRVGVLETLISYDCRITVADVEEIEVMEAEVRRYTEQFGNRWRGEAR